MVQDMTNCNFGDTTAHDYICHARALERFLGCSPETATAGDARRFQVSQIEELAVTLS